MEKECTRCHIVKPLSEYCKGARFKMGVQPACKSCMNIAYNKSRKKKQQHYQQLQRERGKRNRLWLQEYRQTQVCLLCGEDDSVCLDFHHKDPSEKEGDVSDLIYTWSIASIQAEIAKCVVVCSNCHRKIHGGKISLI